MLRHGLYDKVTHVDGGDTTGSNPGLSAIGQDGEIGAVTADMGFGECADPDPRPFGNGVAFAHGDPFFAGEEILIVVSGFDGLCNHRCFDGPFRQQFHPSRIEGDRSIEKHRFEPGDVLFLKLAHPAVIAGTADGVNGYLGILPNKNGTASFLSIDRGERDKSVHPCSPEMFFAAGFVITENAGRKHGGSIAVAASGNLLPRP